MKLIYLSNARIPTEKAHGLQTMKMGEAFASCGLDVELVTPRRFNVIKENPFKYYDVEKKFKIIKLPCLDFIPLDFILGRIAFLIQTISFLISAKIYLSFKKYDILYTREQLTGLFFKDFVLEIHSLPHKIRFFHRRAWQRAKKLIVLTSFIKNSLIEIGIPENKILVAPDGVDLEKFDIEISKKEARKKLNLPEDKILIGYIGMLKTLNMEKGINFAIGSLKFLDNRIVLVLVGGHNKDIEFYKKMVEELQFKNKVLFIGQVPHKSVPMYLKAFDVLIAPFPEIDHYKFYMSPLKIFEYMTSERPIIISNLPAIREVLNESNAILIKPGSPEKLAESINFTLKNPTFADRISKQAHKDVREYTWIKRAERILKFIK